MTRFPLAPLLEAQDCDMLTLADATGFSRRSIYRWERNGLPLASADAAAVALGTHPALVWPDWGEAL